MLQEIAPHLFDNQYRPRPPQAGDCLVYCDPQGIWVESIEPLAFIPYAQPDTGATFLFSIDGRGYYLPQDLPVPIQVEATRISLADLRRAQPRLQAFAAITAYHLYTWYAARRYCGACGGVMQHDAQERMMRCPVCGQQEYPRISPAVIVGIIDGDRLLMTQYVGRPRTHWALVAGYAETGETLEQAVQRETQEEVGLRVRSITYYKSQPWPFSGSLLVGFFAALDGDDKIRLQQEELQHAQWTARQDIDIAFDGISLTNEMICRFRDVGAQGLLNAGAV